MRVYKTLEQQIRELWASREFEVIEERVRSIGKAEFEWVIIAKASDEDKLTDELRKVADEFLEALREEVDSCILLCDAGRLGRLVSAVQDHMDAELIRTIRAKGFSEELSKLCDKVGRKEETI